ncbi:RNA binding protein [Striga asiatica]|uniref:RNA binding protein n=1 Tax=Striga asiatica TaxID=4170 RepID=A0A5A7R4E7_STRAF|nr:RNA binding protein [Striga asiatica]
MSRTGRRQAKRRWGVEAGEEDRESDLGEVHDACAMVAPVPVQSADFWSDPAHNEVLEDRRHYNSKAGITVSDHQEAGCWTHLDHRFELSFEDFGGYKQVHLPHLSHAHHFRRRASNRRASDHLRHRRATIARPHLAPGYLISDVELQHTSIRPPLFIGATTRDRPPSRPSTDDLTLECIYSRRLHSCSLDQSKRFVGDDFGWSSKPQVPFTSSHNFEWYALTEQDCFDNLVISVEVLGAVRTEPDQTSPVTEGRMTGQAFLTFPTVKLARNGLNAVNGYLFISKPMIVQFGRSQAAPKAN